MNTEKTQNLLDRLNQHPAIFERVETILNIVENTSGNCTKANDAEQHTIEALQRLGSDILHSWAENTVQSSVENLKNQRVKLESNGKKNSAGTLNSEKFQF